MVRKTNQISYPARAGWKHREIFLSDEVGDVIGASPSASRDRGSVHDASGSLPTPLPPFVSTTHLPVTMAITAVAGVAVAAPASSSLRAGRNYRGAAAVRVATRPVASTRRGMSESPRPTPSHAFHAGPRRAGRRSMPSNSEPRAPRAPIAQPVPAHVRNQPARNRGMNSNPTPSRRSL